MRTTSRICSRLLPRREREFDDSERQNSALSTELNQFIESATQSTQSLIHPTQLAQNIDHRHVSIAQCLPVELLILVWIFADGLSRFHLLQVCSWWRQVFLENFSHPDLRDYTLRIRLNLYSEHRIERFLFRTIYLAIDPFISCIDILVPDITSLQLVDQVPPFGPLLPLVVERCPNLKILHISHQNPDRSYIVLGSLSLDEHFYNWLSKNITIRHVEIFKFFYLGPATTITKSSDTFWQAVKSIIRDWEYMWTLQARIEFEYGVMYCARKRCCHLCYSHRWAESSGYILSW
ncbi:625_t:CDS:2 [Paraglomus brasilianum]|uniref:625_t:CDS:1 n=1 Tax=Paraglomus brasilianum TaxID=144538 RepID=A0A9N9C0N4_9GLOM|nr:625_t:CDS:2 [Paraglomus brasilianum]